MIFWGGCWRWSQRPRRHDEEESQELACQMMMEDDGCSHFVSFFFFFTVILPCIFSFSLFKHSFVNSEFSLSFLCHFWSWCIYILVILTEDVTFWTTQAAEQRILLVCWTVCFWWCFRLRLIHKRNTGFFSFQLPHFPTFATPDVVYWILYACPDPNRTLAKRTTEQDWRARRDWIQSRRRPF